MNTPEQIAARAKAVAKLQREIGLDAAAVGELDLSLGLKELTRLARAHRVRLLAANLVDAKGKRPFESSFMTTVAGVKIGLLGVTEVPPQQAESIKSAGLTVEPPAEAAAREAKKLRERGAVVVVALAHVGFGGARRLLKAVEGIDLAIAGHTSNKIEYAVPEGKGYLVEAYRQGKMLGEFMLHVQPQGTGLVDGGRRAASLERIQQQEQGFRQAAQRFENAKNPTQRKLFHRRLESLRRSAIATCRQAQAPAAAPTGSHWFTHRLVEMGPSVPDDPAIAKGIAAYKKAAGIVTDKPVLRRPLRRPGKKR